MITLPHFCPGAVILRDAKTPHAALKYAVEHAAILTLWPDGSFSAYFDDIPNDVRYGMDYHGRTSAKVWQVHEYDPKAHCWKTSGRDALVCYDTTRGRAGCRAIHVEYAKKLNRYHSTTLDMYRNAEGKWYI